MVELLSLLLHSSSGSIPRSSANYSLVELLGVKRMIFVRHFFDAILVTEKVAIKFFLIEFNDGKHFLSRRFVQENHTPGTDPCSDNLDYTSALTLKVVSVTSINSAVP